MGLFGKTDHTLGVDIGAGGIKLVELKKAKDRAQVWTYGIADQVLDIHVAGAAEQPDSPGDMPQNPYAAEMATTKTATPRMDVRNDARVAEYARVLKELMKQANVTAKKATASLPVSYVFHAVITLPEVDVKELKHHVDAKVKKMLPQPIEEMQVVHQVIPQKKTGDTKNIRVLVTAAPKTLIEFYTAIFHAAGLQLEELETEAFALERSLIGNDPATAMIVDIGAQRTNFFIIDAGLPLTHRSIALGGDTITSMLQSQLGLDPETTEQTKRDMVHMTRDSIDIQKYAELTSPIIKEIQYGFDLYLSQSGNEGKKPEKIILTGGSAVFPPIAAALQDHFSMRVFVGDPWARTVFQQPLQPLLQDIGPRMGVAIGLALRNISS